jgi:hypothetical protein
MSTKTLCALVAVVSALVPAAAQAHEGDRSTIVFSVENPGDATASCAPDDWFGISFEMVSLSGAQLGSGRNCVHSIDDGCVPFEPFCRQTVRATLTLNFAAGSITAPIRLREILPTEFSFIQRGKGKIAAGTGDFAGARGHVKGGGPAAFTDQGFVGELVYVVVLKGDAEEDD